MIASQKGFPVRPDPVDDDALVVALVASFTVSAAGLRDFAVNSMAIPFSIASITFFMLPSTGRVSMGDPASSSIA
jgi:hypothetical protein